MDPLTHDLISAAGYLIATRLNAFPEHLRKIVQEAHDAGGWCEVQVGILNNACSIRLVVRNVDGREAELTRQDVVLGQ